MCLYKFWFNFSVFSSNFLILLWLGFISSISFLMIKMLISRICKCHFFSHSYLPSFFLPNAFSKPHLSLMHSYLFLLYGFNFGFLWDIIPLKNFEDFKDIYFSGKLFSFCIYFELSSHLLSGLKLFWLFLTLVSLCVLEF